MENIIATKTKDKQVHSEISYGGKLSTKDHCINISKPILGLQLTAYFECRALALDLKIDI